MKNLNKLISEMSKRLYELNEIITGAENFLKSAPPGRLITCKNHNTNQYYFKNSSTSPKIYLSKKNMDRISELAQKEYNLAIVKVARNQQQLIAEFLKKYNFDEIENVYNNLKSGRKPLITPYELPIEEFAKKWLISKKNKKEKLSQVTNWKYQFANNTNYNIVTEKGELVRSKSEKILADKLYYNGIPYIYEMPLKLGDFYIHPDFTILSLKSKQEYIWEHFGMLDDPNYAEKFVNKVETYHKHNFYLGENLIMTYETKAHPINSETIDEYINKYLL